MGCLNQSQPTIYEPGNLLFGPATAEGTALAAATRSSGSAVTNCGYAHRHQLPLGDDLEVALVYLENLPSLNDIEICVVAIDGGTATAAAHHASRTELARRLPRLSLERRILALPELSGSCGGAALPELSSSLAALRQCGLLSHRRHSEGKRNGEKRCGGNADRRDFLCDMHVGSSNERCVQR